MNQQGAHRYEDRLLEFAYGELPAAEARSIEAHVKGCARCTGALREIEGVRHQMSQLAPEPAPDAGLESLLAYAQQSARRAQVGPAPSRGLRRWFFGAAGAASLAAVLVVVGVVANRPELAPASVEALKKDAAKEQLREAESAAPAPAAVATSEQPLAQGQGKADPAPEKQEKNYGAGDLDDQEGPTPQVAAAPAEPKPEAKVGKDVGKRNEWVQQVDVSSGNRGGDRAQQDRKLATKDAPQYRMDGPDSFDKGQNFIPGRGTRPVLPTTGTQGQGYASKMAPADGEMMLDGTKGTGLSKPKKSAKKAPTRAPLAGSGGGLGMDEGIGRAAGAKINAPAKPARDEDDFGSVTFGKEGSVGAGVARPSTPPAQVLDTRLAKKADDLSRAAADSKQRERTLAEETSRRRAEETQKLEVEKKAVRAQAQMEEPPPQVELAKKAPATRSLPPAPAPAPAAATPAPSGSSASGSRAMNAPAGPAEAPAAAPPPPPEEQASIPLKASSSVQAPRRNVAESPTQQKSKVYAQNAQELFNTATLAPSGSAEEIDGLIRALNAGLAGQYRVDALQRLCTRMEDQGDDRAVSYCSAWARAAPSSEMANKRLREATARKARAKQATETLDSVESSPAKASEQQKVDSVLKK